MNYGCHCCVAIVAVQFDPGDDIPQAHGPPEDLAVPQCQGHGPGEGASVISGHGTRYYPRTAAYLVLILTWG